jgi:hypothetical protein
MNSAETGLMTPSTVRTIMELLAEFAGGSSRTDKNKMKGISDRLNII